jgi:hypothetical protein
MRAITVTQEEHLLGYTTAIRLTYNWRAVTLTVDFVLQVGLEPTLLRKLGFESSASANSATRACNRYLESGQPRGKKMEENHG